MRRSSTPYLQEVIPRSFAELLDRRGSRWSKATRSSKGERTFKGSRSISRWGGVSIRTHVSSRRHFGKREDRPSATFLADRSDTRMNSCLRILTSPVARRNRLGGSFLPGARRRQPRIPRVTQGRSGPDSSPCSRPPRSRGQTWSANLHSRKPPPGGGVGSWLQR